MPSTRHEVCKEVIWAKDSASLATELNMAINYDAEGNLQKIPKIYGTILWTMIMNL
jgi:hypothetical protein